MKSSKQKIHPAPPILKHGAKAADACKIIQSASAPKFIPQPLEADEEEATEAMPTADLVTEVACRSSFLAHTIGCEKPESKLKSEVVPSILKDRKKKKVEFSNVVVEVSEAEGQKLREQVVAQETLGVKTWFGVPEVEVAQLRWREPEAQQVATKMALVMVRCVPASEVSQAEIQAACANEQLCGVLLSKFQSAMTESGSEVKLVQWVQAMEGVWSETHHRLRLTEEKLLRDWGPVTKDGDDDMLWAKVSEMLTETCSRRAEGFNPN